MVSLRVHCYLLVALCIAHFAASQTCSSSTPSLTDLQSIAGTKGFSLFYQGLVQTQALNLTATSTLTILAPLDAAWTADLTALGLPVNPSSWTAAQAKLMKGLLMYHILPGQPGKYLNRTNVASLKKTVSSTLDTFVCGPGSIVIPLNDTDPIDNINSVTLDYTSNVTTKIYGVYKNATANETELTTPCFSGVSIYTLDNVILPCNPNSPCAMSATVNDKLTATGQPILASYLADVFPDQLANGTVLVPTNAAFNAALQSIQDMFAAMNMTVPTTADIMGLPQMADILAYHIITAGNLGATPATGARDTLLSAATEQTFCNTASPAQVTITRTGTTITATDETGNVANVTVASNPPCNGVIYNIDAVLLPCNFKDSIIATLLVGKPSPSPKVSPKPSPSPSLAKPNGSPSPAPGTSPTPKGTSAAAPQVAFGTWVVLMVSSFLLLVLSH